MKFAKAGLTNTAKKKPQKIQHSNSTHSLPLTIFWSTSTKGFNKNQINCFKVTGRCFAESTRCFIYLGHNLRIYKDKDMGVFLVKQTNRLHKKEQRPRPTLYCGWLMSVLALYATGIVIGGSHHLKSRLSVSRIRICTVPVRKMNVCTKVPHSIYCTDETTNMFI